MSTSPLYSQGPWQVRPKVLQIQNLTHSPRYLLGWNLFLLCKFNAISTCQTQGQTQEQCLHCVLETVWTSREESTSLERSTRCRCLQLWWWQLSQLNHTILMLLNSDNPVESNHGERTLIYLITNPDRIHRTECPREILQEDVVSTQNYGKSKDFSWSHFYR